MKQATRYQEPAEDYAPDDELTVWPNDEIHPILGYVDPMLRVHVGYCDACRNDSMRTVGQVLACMAARAK